MTSPEQRKWLDSERKKMQASLRTKAAARMAWQLIVISVLLLVVWAVLRGNL